MSTPDALVAERRGPDGPRQRVLHGSKRRPCRRAWGRAARTHRSSVAAVAPRLHASPTPSAAGAAHPVPGLSASVIDLPRVPFVPEQAPPPQATLPAGVQALPSGPVPASNATDLDALASFAVTPDVALRLSRDSADA